MEITKKRYSVPPQTKAGKANYIWTFNIKYFYIYFVNNYFQYK